MPRPSLHLLHKLTLLLTALSLSYSSHVYGYCRTNACELDRSMRDIYNQTTCQRDENGCVIERASTTWPSPCLEYVVQDQGSTVAQLGADQVQRMVQAAFDVWRSAQCPGGGTPGFIATFQGFASCNQRETLCGGFAANMNTIMFHDQDWPHDPATLAVTTPAGSSRTGELVDADMELNANAADYKREEGFIVLTHEIGHFLGLTHSSNPDALMYYAYQSLPLDNLLSPDDIAGICEIFPPLPYPPRCAVLGPTYDTCQQDGAPLRCEIEALSPPLHEAPASCSFIPGRGEASPFGAWFVGLLLGGLLCRRQRRAPNLQNLADLPRNRTCRSGRSWPYRQRDRTNV
jgi:hypothetical protein